jgi:hypothetical protein
MAAPSSTLGSFHYHLSKAACGKPINRLPSKYTNSLSSLLIRPHATIEHLASNHSNTMTSKRPSLHSAARLVLLLVNSDATATRSFSAARYDYSYTPTTHLLPPVWQEANLPMALLRPTGNHGTHVQGIPYRKANAPNILILGHQALS